MQALCCAINALSLVHADKQWVGISVRHEPQSDVAQSPKRSLDADMATVRPGVYLTICHKFASGCNSCDFGCQFGAWLVCWPFRFILCWWPRLMRWIRHSIFLMFAGAERTGEVEVVDMADLRRRHALVAAHLRLLANGVPAEYLHGIAVLFCWAFLLAQERLTGSCQRELPVLFGSSWTAIRSARKDLQLLAVWIAGRLFLGLAICRSLTHPHVHRCSCRPDSPGDVQVPCRPQPVRHRHRLGLCTCMCV